MKRQIDLKTCPTCGASVAILLTDCKTGKRFCHNCHDEFGLRHDHPVVIVNRKIHEHMVNGTLDSYPLSERLKDLYEYWKE